MYTDYAMHSKLWLEKTVAVLTSGDHLLQGTRLSLDVTSQRP